MTRSSVDLHNCARVRGRSVRECVCRVEGGWLECPPETRGPGLVTLVSRPPTLTGDFCAECGGVSLARAGTCLLCLDCGSTSGGCS